MTLHARSEWTSKPCPSGRPAGNVPYIYVHHEGGGVRGNPADKPAVLREIEGYVLGKGYVAIDYNLMVFADGSIWEGRGLDHEDAATLARNAVGVSICAVGNYEREPTTPALVAGIAEAVRMARAGGWAAPDSQVLGHRDAGTFSTSCPGANLEAQLPNIRTLASGGAPTPAPEDDVEHGMLVDAVVCANGVALNLDRWGGLHNSGGLIIDGGGAWPHQDVARKIVLTSASLLDPHAPLTGYVVDLLGFWHGFAQRGTSIPPDVNGPGLGHWSGGKIVAFDEV